MRSFRHLTPIYAVNRIRTIYYEKTCPTCPWLTRAANEILNSYLTTSDIGLEFGSGRSTVWLAKRVAHITSVEHDEHWVEKVRDMLTLANVNNVDYRWIPEKKVNDENENAEYVSVVDGFDENGLDFCLIDGIFRDFCALRVMEKLRPGGILIVDNVNQFLPSTSASPNSRTAADGPKGDIWNTVYQRLSAWRRIWTSSGVTDTALFFKPYSRPD